MVLIQKPFQSCIGSSHPSLYHKPLQNTNRLVFPPNSSLLLPFTVWYIEISDCPHAQTRTKSNLEPCTQHNMIHSMNKGLPTHLGEFICMGDQTIHYLLLSVNTRQGFDIFWKNYDIFFKTLWNSMPQKDKMKLTL